MAHLVVDRSAQSIECEQEWTTVKLVKLSRPPKGDGTSETDGLHKLFGEHTEYTADESFSVVCCCGLILVQNGKHICRRAWTSPIMIDNRRRGESLHRIQRPTRARRCQSASPDALQLLVAKVFDLTRRRSVSTPPYCRRVRRWRRARRFRRQSRHSRC